jgi:perosamine synthetase
MIPVFKPIIDPSDIKAAVNALKRGEISGTFGKSIIELEKNYSKYIGTKYAVSVTSGSTALHLAIAALELPKGSEIIVSATTNIASGLAITHNCCVPIPIDSNKYTWNLNSDLIKKHITKKTKAIMVVHFLGNPADMLEINKIAQENRLYIIEDAAEAHGADIDKKKIGSFGMAGCFSFYANKAITCGEGGIITTNNKKYYEKLRLYRNLGFTIPRFVHYIRGFNFRMTGYQAALVNNQLKRINKINKIKIKISNLYKKYLKNVDGVTFQTTIKNSTNVCWMVGLLLNNKYKISKNKLKKKLKEKKIETRDFFKSIAGQPCFSKIIHKKKTPISDNLWKNGIYLPSSYDISEKEIKNICEVIKKYSR